MFFKAKVKPKVSAIVVAAGSGSRMGIKKNKVFLELLGVPVLARTLLVFQNIKEIEEIIVVSKETEISDVLCLAEEYKIKKLKKVVCGGETRQDSVFSGLLEISDDSTVVLIHDGARPLVTCETVLSVINEALISGAAAPGVKNKNTLKKIDQNGFITDTLDRENIVEIQTPQGFKKDLILSAYNEAKKSGFVATDDCMIAENAGEKVKVVFSGSDNIKITTKDDLALCEQILEKRGE